VVVVDAQRREFYCAPYELTPTDWRSTGPIRLATESEVRERANAAQMLIGPEVTKWFAGGRIVVPRAAMVARLAARQQSFARGEELEPIYLRATTFVKAPPPRVQPG
jgi:hypothetical protein